MRVSLTRCNLMHQRARTLAAVGGVAFAIVLVFMQLGFLGSAESAATVLFEQLDFDLVVVSSEYVELSRASSFPRCRLAEAEACPGVADTVPVYLGFQLWRNPEMQSRRRRTMLIVGFHPSERPFRLTEIVQASERLTDGDAVLIDRRSRPEFGPKDVGVETELGRLRVTIAGQFTLGTGFVSDGLVLVSDRTFARILGGAPLSRVSLGLVKLQPGYAVHEVAAQLRQALPEDVRIRTRSEIEARDCRHWVENTALGTVFRFGVFVSLTVGAVFLYQVMSSDISNHRSEYATLKALGYSNAHLARLVLEQANYVALLAYVPGLAVALALYALTRYVAVIPIGMTLERAVLVLLLALGACSLSGLCALRGVNRADPADLM